jgi:hypothetical protein
MDPITIGLLAGGAYLLFKKPAAAPVVALPSGPLPPVSTPTSIIQYSGAVDAPRGDSSTTASPIEQTGYIPPYIAAAGPSAVALGGLGACGCASCLGGLGDAKADRQALHTQLKALRATFRAQIQAAIKAKNPGAVHAIVLQMRTQLKALLDAYHAAHPNENKNVTHVAPSVAPHFMAKDRRRTAVHTGV